MALLDLVGVDPDEMMQNMLLNSYRTNMNVGDFVCTSYGDYGTVLKIYLDVSGEVWYCDLEEVNTKAKLEGLPVYNCLLSSRC